ncbi:hypothetical protein Tco_0626883 [Tanacetum coccineum]|uniref:Uncharacterized protein n=1 Tax=Tanacetum coccineum TaxID=301880 RepID=A0ABQ4WLP2_9ASTR
MNELEPLLQVVLLHLLNFDKILRLALGFISESFWIVTEQLFDGFMHLAGKLFSKVFGLWSNPNKEPKLGRSCREELGTVACVGTGVCCICVMRGVGGGGRVVVDKRGGSTIVVTETSISKVDSVLRLNIESIPVSGLGLSMLETKADDTEELCC